MKSIALIFSAFVLLCMDSCSQDFKKLKESEVELKQVQIAEKFAGDLLTKLRDGSYYQFQDDAIDELKNLLTEENQKAVYQQVKEQFGDFQKLDYAETWIQSANPAIRIFRFKGDFEGSSTKLEIRVVLNESDKIAGFWVIPWSDMFK